MGNKRVRGAGEAGGRGNAAAARRPRAGRASRGPTRRRGIFLATVGRQQAASRPRSEGDHEAGDPPTTHVLVIAPLCRCSACPAEFLRQRAAGADLRQQVASRPR